MEKVAESTSVAESLRLSKEFHKVWLFFLKVIPMVMAGLCLSNTVLSYFDIDLTIFSYLAGIGFIPWLFLLLSSYLFHFCEYHRMFLYYIAVNNIICWIDYTYHLPISNWNYLVFHIIIAGIFLFVILYLHQKEVKKKRALH